MYAYFVPGGRYRTRIVQQYVLGMPLLRVELPLRLTKRRERLIVKKLKSFGVHRLLSALPFSDPTLLPPLIETRPLWKLHAVAAILALLEQQHLSPKRSIVELADTRFSDSIQQLALSLIPLVGHISLSMPIPESFAWSLQREYGVTPLSCPGDISICFIPVERKLSLPLWMDIPSVPGLTLTLPGLTLPDGCPPLPLLSALAQQGRIDPKQLQISTDCT